jgi:DNA polymerase-3 subunit alpha
MVPQRPKLTELPVMIPPLEVFSFQKDTDKAELHMITVVLRSNFNEADQGVLRMKRVVGLLRSYPGKDRFGVLIFERGKYFRFEFPNDTTGFCPELMWKLQKLVGEENVQIEIMHVH